ncbi:hypothetical protein SASPL_108504 [Salvia splendens]|uniref:Uncharacterized protein n=1 Tax=Salvia splendens TaxID=180675 RepID=A0A8X9A696_SALSN|nr:hypothetical protein SASPL_108504 [Salvia splendens]
MASQLQATTPESDWKSDVSADAFDESTFFLRRCCCVWTFPCYGTLKPKIGSEFPLRRPNTTTATGAGRATEWRRLRRKLRELQGDEDRVLRLVREITEYFHGDVSKDESNPLRIFVIIRDFLSMLDN